jgi:hypothetical protein
MVLLAISLAWRQQRTPHPPNSDRRSHSRITVNTAMVRQLCYLVCMSQEPQKQEPAQGLTGPRILMFVLTFLPPFILYKVGESMALGAGMGKWTAIGIGSLGAVLGALLVGVVFHFLYGRKNQSKALHFEPFFYQSSCLQWLLSFPKLQPAFHWIPMRYWLRS